MKKYSFDFLPQGAQINVTEDFFEFSRRINGIGNEYELVKWPRKSTVILDTGNHLIPGIIDHHQPDSSVAESCVASIVVQDAPTYLDHLKNEAEVLIVTHFNPDLDAMGAVYFTKKFLDGNKFSAFDYTLADYILEVDSGKLSIDPDFPVSIASIWLSVTNQGLRDNQAILHKGFDFFDKVIELMSINPSPWSIHFLENLQGFDTEIDLINQDIKQYQLDLERSTRHTVELFNIELGGKDEVDVIITSQPSSFLWKYWVRGDRKGSPNHKGFIFTCAHFNRRSIISVDPNTPYNLKGLGLLIDHAEIKILEQEHTIEDIEFGKIDDSGKRPGTRTGFHRNDPWYDGRGFHNFTIIDAPRVGTELSEDAIKDLILNTELWQLYGVYLDEKVEDIDSKDGINNVLKKFTLKDLLQLPILTSESTDGLMQLEIPSTFDIIDLQIENQKSIIQTLANLRFKLKSELIISYWYKEHCVNYIQALSEGLNSIPTNKFFQLKQDLTLLIADKLDYESIKLFILSTIDLPSNAVLKCLERVKLIIPNKKYIYFLMDIQNLHPKSFYLNSKNLLHENVNKNVDLITFFPVSEEQQYDLPIYAYNSLKNYVDDLIVCTEFDGAKYKFDHPNKYISIDFSSNFNDEGETEISIGDSIRRFDEFKDKILTHIYSSNLDELRILRQEILKNTKGIVAKTIKQYSLEELLLLDYQEINQLIKNLEPELSKDQSNYLDFLRYIEVITAISNLQYRLSNFNKLTCEDFEKGFHGNQFLLHLNRFVYRFFYMQAIHLQYSDPDEVERLLKDLVGEMNTLRTLQDQSPNIDIDDFYEKILAFINNLISEINTPLEDIDQLLILNLDQYQLIAGNGGIIDTVKSTFPSFYQYFLLEIAIGFKRNYTEKIRFIREDLVRLAELVDSQEELKANESFNKIQSYILNATIKYDWQEIKDRIDSDEHVDKQLFYDKYFYWISIYFETLNNLDNSDSKNQELALLNSKIIFSIGKSDGDLNNLVSKLPYSSNENIKSNFNYTSFQKQLIFNAKKDTIVSHLPNKFLHQGFDYISKLYIDRFDVDTAKQGLYSYSTNFPFYYNLFTRTNILRFVSIVLIAMLFLVGCFDGNVYCFNTKSEYAPIASHLRDLVDPTIFSILNKLFTGFWISVLSLSFILPIFFFLIVIKKYYFPKSNDLNSESFKFLELIQGTESKQSNLLYFSFIVPLIFVVVQMASSDTIAMINNITGVRLISTLIIIIGLTISAVYMHVKERNKYKNTSWLLRKTEHMFWLHILQALLITIFIIDLMLRLDVTLDNFQNHDELFTAGISKFIKLEIGPFDFVVMPVFTLIVALLTLFFSFFIDKVLGNKE